MTPNDGGNALVNARSRRIKYDHRRPRRRRSRLAAHAATVEQRRIACMRAARQISPRVWRRRSR